MIEPAPNRADALKAGEAAARRAGSGIRADALAGEWWLQRVWSREGGDQSASSALLRAVGASLTICPSSRSGPLCGLGLPSLEVCNRVRLGPLLLQFSGPGWLRGKRPLLHFHFERMALIWGERTLGQAALPEPGRGRLPFFALIGCQRSGDQGWLTARGRGGGLAQWQLRPTDLRG